MVLSIHLEDGKGDTDSEGMEKVLLNILSDIQTPQLHHQVNSCHIGFTQTVPAICGFLLVCLCFFLFGGEKRIAESV